MADLPLVTIGLSTYNRADSYLPQALDSALAQTYEPLEVIVSDNASTDATEEVVLGRNNPRLRYLRQERNIGANANFNACLEAARGEYFLLLHDDDRIDADFVETCMRATQAAGEVGVIRSGTRVIDSRNRVLAEHRNACQGLPSHELFLAWFHRKTAFYLASTLFNTKRLRESGGFGSKTNLYQDVVALARLAVPYGRVDVPEVKASFRRHDANKGSSDNVLAWAEDSLYLIGVLEELMPEYAGELREAGLPYLCRKCYRNASAIASFTERWRTYWEIYDRFERSYSPMRYALEKAGSRGKSLAARMVRGGPQVARTLHT